MRLYSKEVQTYLHLLNKKETWGKVRKSRFLLCLMKLTDGTINRWNARKNNVKEMHKSDASQKNDNHCYRIETGDEYAYNSSNWGDLLII